jgi:hypothetical protein
VTTTVRRLNLAGASHHTPKLQLQITVRKKLGKRIQIFSRCRNIRSADGEENILLFLNQSIFNCNCNCNYQKPL